MNETNQYSDASHVDPSLGAFGDIDSYTPELSALREARKRAFDARIAAETALRQAEEAEAGLRAQEELAVAAATAARREQAAEVVRVAGGREREALGRLSRIEIQLQQCVQAREQAQVAASSVRHSRDEAQRALDRLDASLAGFQAQLATVEANERNLEAEIALVRSQAQEATRARQSAELLIQAVDVPFGASPPMPEAEFVRNEAGEASLQRPAPVSDLLAIAAQRAAERRAADAARMQERS